MANILEQERFYGRGAGRGDQGGGNPDPEETSQDVPSVLGGGCPTGGGCPVDVGLLLELTVDPEGLLPGSGSSALTRGSGNISAYDLVVPLIGRLSGE